MKKKIALMIIMIVIGVFVLVGCENNNTSNNKSNELNNAINLDVNNDKNDVINNDDSNGTVTAVINGKKYELNEEKNVNKLYYKYPSSVEFRNDKNDQAAIDFKEEEKVLFSIIITYKKDKTIEKFLEERGDNEKELTSKEINGRKWETYIYDDGETYSKVNMYQDENDIYIVSFPMNAKNKVDIDKFIEIFINNIDFK